MSELEARLREELRRMTENRDRLQVQVDNLLAEVRNLQECANAQMRVGVEQEQELASLRAEVARLRPDAERYRWLRMNALQVYWEPDSIWTRWLVLACIPYRTQTEEPSELLDALIERFPLDAALASEKVND